MVNPASLTVTASDGSMTYGGTPPAITASYIGFVNGDSSSSLTTAPGVLHGRHEPQLGGRFALRLVLLGSGRPQLHDQLPPGSVVVEPCVPHGHGFERVDDLRRHATDDHRQLLRAS